MEKYDLVVWGSLAGIVGAATFSILWGLAILTDGHWLFGVETLSELGGFRPGRDLFNSGVTVMGSLSFVTTIGVVMTGYVTIALVALEVMELALSEALVVIALVIWVLLLGSTMLLGRPRTSSASSTTRGNDS
jgi:hypothetical membrane protein